MDRYLTQVETTIGDPLQGIGTYGRGGSGSPARFTRALTAIIGILTLIAGIYFIFLLISGGIEWMSSGGDKGKLASARSRMFSGVIGLAIVVAALFITEILGQLVGFPTILDPAGTLVNLVP